MASLVKITCLFYKVFPNLEYRLCYRALLISNMYLKTMKKKYNFSRLKKSIVQNTAYYYKNLFGQQGSNYVPKKSTMLQQHRVDVATTTSRRHDVDARLLQR